MRLRLAAMLSLSVLWVGCGRSELGGVSSTLVIGPADLDFGDVAVGTVEERALSVTNASDRAVEVSKVRVPAPFAVKPGAFGLAPNESTAITVSFRPREPGEHDDAVLTFVSEALRGGELDVPLRAVAKRPPEVVVDPLRIGFGAVAVASRGRAIVSVANRGDLPLHVSSMGSPFPFRSDAAEFVVEPHGRRSVEVSYAPDVAGEHRAQLLVRSDDPKRGLVVVNVEGSGVEKAPRPVIGSSAEALEFGQVKLGERRELLLWIRNEGADPLELTSLTSLAPFAAASRGRRVAPGKAARIPVTFAPDQEGGQLVPLTIYSNDPERPVLIVSLIGEGTREASASPRVDTAERETGAPDAGATPMLAGDPSLLGDDASRAEHPAAQAPSPDRPLVEAGGYVYVGTLRSAISASSLQSWSFDPASGLLSLNGFTPPTVQYPFGQSFEFAPVDVSGVVSPAGDFSVPGTLTMVNENGTPMEVHGTFTTGDASYETNGIQATVSGTPLDGGSDGRIVFVGLGPDGTPAEKLPVVIEIPVAQPLQREETVAHAQ